MMKKTIVSMAFAATLFGLSAHAADIPVPMIGILDMKRIEEETKAFRSFAEQRDKKLSEVKARMEARGEELQKERDKLEKRRQNMSEEAFMEKAQAFQRDVFEYQTAVRTEEERLKAAMLDAVSEFNEKGLRPAMNDISEQKGLNLILAKEIALYSGQGLDITKEIIAILDKKYPTISLRFDADKDAGKESKKVDSKKPADKKADDKKKK